MVKKSYIPNQQGFTLIELMAVMVIMGVLITVAVKKFDRLSDMADYRVLEAGILEINMRETMIWSNTKLSSGGWTNDGDVFSQLDTNLGAHYSWNPGPTIAGGTLSHKSQSIALDRIPSTNTSSGRWEQI